MAIQNEKVKMIKMDYPLTLDQLYAELRNLVKDDIVIVIRDRQRYNKNPTVGLEHEEDRYCWVTFEGKDLTDAFELALHKLEHPEKDYVS